MKRSWSFIAWDVALGALMLFIILFASPARAQHDNPRNKPLLAYAMCPTLEGALAIVGAPVPRLSLRLWAVYDCFYTGNDGVRVVAHKIAAERVWIADGLGDVMVVLEIYDITGQRAWTWVVKGLFARQFPDQLRLLQPTMI